MCDNAFSLALFNFSEFLCLLFFYPYDAKILMKICKLERKIILFQKFIEPSWFVAFYCCECVLGNPTRVKALFVYHCLLYLSRVALIFFSRFDIATLTCECVFTSFSVNFMCARDSSWKLF